jgi:single-strand DNA-binding protein
LYRFKMRIPKPFKNKNGEIGEDIINIKVWSGNLEDEAILHDQANIGIEGRIQSFPSKDMKSVFNEILAHRVYYLG